LPDKEELAKLLEQPQTLDPELLRLALLLANKAMDNKLNIDDDGALIVRDVNF